MSVYTTIEQDELEAFLLNYRVGDLVDYTGISDGIENTNYFVNTSQGQYVLTIFEELSAQELPYFLDLMAFLAEHEVPSAHPIEDKKGKFLRTLKDKPAALVIRLTGKGINEPNAEQCRALGDSLGKLHAVSHQFTGHRDNPRGPTWWHEMSVKLDGKLSAREREILDTEMSFQNAHRRDELPTGVIHADLFRDNALFDENKLTGIIDFYYACNDVQLYDLAITVNDWCSNPDGSLDTARVSAMLASYVKKRPLLKEEAQAWPMMLRAAALRFWLSRLHDKHFPKEGEMTHIKDPDVFKKILINRIENSDSYLYTITEIESTVLFSI